MSVMSMAHDSRKEDGKFDIPEAVGGSITQRKTSPHSSSYSTPSNPNTKEPDITDYMGEKTDSMKLVRYEVPSFQL